MNPAFNRAQKFQHCIRRFVLSAKCKDHIQAVLLDYTNATLEYVQICGTKWRHCWNNGSKFEKSKDEILIFFLFASEHHTEGLVFTFKI